MEYELTPLGLSLRAPIYAITDWAGEHLGEILSAREAAPRSVPTEWWLR